MTTRYAEALARIEGEIAECQESINDLSEVTHYLRVDIATARHRRTLSAWTTLKAALKLHHLGEGDWDENANAREPAHWCACCSDVFPCPTADLIIEGVLG